MKNNHTKSIAFSGMASALCVAILYVGSIIDVLDYTVSALCGIIVTVMIVEFGRRVGIGIWIASSIIALLILPAKFSALLFVAFCGWYSVLKGFLELHFKKGVCWLLKLCTFNVVLIFIYFITLRIMLVPDVTPLISLGVFALSNFVFVIYDILLTRIISIYIFSWRKKLTFLKK